MEVGFPEIGPGDEIRISASTFVTYKKCPAQAEARLQGLYGPDSRPSFVGSLAHRIFSRHLGSGPIGDLDQACREEIGSGLNHRLAGLGLSRPSMLAPVIEEVRGLYDRFVRLSSEGFEGAEVMLQVEPAAGVELVGSVDAVYRADPDGHRLVDWKTGELGEPEDQLLFYALLWTLDRGESPATVEAVSVRTGERYRTTPGRSDLVRIAAEIADMVNAIRKSWAGGPAPERTAGPWCRGCVLLEDCPEGRSAGALLG